MNPTREQLEKVLCDNPHILQKELADQFNVSVRKMPYILRKYGLHTERSAGLVRVPREDLEKALKDYPGISIRYLAKLLGFGRHVISMSLEDYGLKTDNHGSGQKRVIEAYKKGFDTPYKMSNELGMSEGACRRWMVLLEIWHNGLAEMPTCKFCGDPVDPADKVFGGEGDVHFLCQAHQERQGAVVYHLYAGDDEIL